MRKREKPGGSEQAPREGLDYTGWESLEMLRDLILFQRASLTHSQPAAIRDWLEAREAEGGEGGEGG